MTPIERDVLVIACQVSIRSKNIGRGLDLLLWRRWPIDGVMSVPRPVPLMHPRQSSHIGAEKIVFDTHLNTLSARLEESSGLQTDPNLQQGEVSFLEALQHRTWVG